MSDLRSAETHFAFGRNWASYAEGVGEAQIAEAMKAMQRLLGRESLAGKSFLDIGCGSGLHCLAAIRLGATRVVAIDIDRDSVATTKGVLERFAPQASFHVEHRSVFDLSDTTFGRFDVVYSWGVLHHTGDLTTALARAAGCVAPGGVLLIALYRKTFLCGFWRVEKKWYTSASPAAQRRAQSVYLLWFRFLVWAAGVFRRSSREDLPPDLATYASEYHTRGMSFRHDIHDWLGGYPYESILPDEVDRLMEAAGLRPDAAFLCRPARGKARGLLGSGCDEYRYLKP